MGSNFCNFGATFENDFVDFESTLLKLDRILSKLVQLEEHYFWKLESNFPKLLSIARTLIKHLKGRNIELPKLTLSKLVNVTKKYQSLLFKLGPFLTPPGEGGGGGGRAQ